MRKTWIIGVLALIVGCSSCSKYLDVVPDNIATLDNAFTMRSEAEKYLYTCYSYMPLDAEVASNPALLSGDEIWAIPQSPMPYFDHSMLKIARGFQNANAPIGNATWDNLYKGLRDCNIFLEKVTTVPDLELSEMNQWIAEVKFLKAYYHFYLVRMYGPIPLIKKNLPVDVAISEVKVSRAPVDSCFAYINQLINESVADLSPDYGDPTKMAGRITRLVALSLKAKVLVTAASPLFNGNSEQASLVNKDGTKLFNTTYDPVKWDSAVVACKTAIDVCQANAISLYHYVPTVVLKLSDTINTQMSLRNVFTERWNSEIIWANTQSVANSLQRWATPFVNEAYLSNPNLIGELGAPLKIAEMFYTQNGVPINEDNTRTGTNWYSLRKALAKDQLYIRKDFNTVELNYDREPRFYADLAFDGGIWYGQGIYDDKIPASLFCLHCKKGEPNGKAILDRGITTGYYLKKYVHYQNVMGSGTTDYSITTYPWPIIRLADLYLLYAEALNEANLTPTNDVYSYVNQIRARAGLKTVQESWTNFSTNPSKYTTKEGMRMIIHQERGIELAFEGQRFWDLRRWKEAPEKYQRALESYDIEQSVDLYFYRPKFIIKQSFGQKDYFWPIKDSYIENNRNLVQNIGW